MIWIVNNGNIKSVALGKQLTGDKIPGDLNTWDYMTTDPNAIVELSYEQLSQRSTTLYHEHPPIKAAINKMTHYAIGPGLVFRSQPDWDILGITPEAAKDWGRRFQKLVHHLSQMLNFYDKQSVLFRTGLIMGDSLLLFDRNTPPNGLPFDLIEVGGDQIQFDAVDTTLGIFTDKLLRRQAVSLNGTKTQFNDPDTGNQILLQFYLKNMARQLRGFPLAYSLIAAAKNNDRLMDATLSRAVLESILLGTSSTEDAESLRREVTSLANDQKEQAGGTGDILTQDAGTRELGTGGIFSFGKGGIEFTDLKTPSKGFKDMQETYYDLVAMATDTPPEVLLGRYSTSYTAHKGAFNDYIKSYMMKRGACINSIHKPVIREMAKYFILNGLIESPHEGFFNNPIIQAAALSGNYLGPIPGSINPVQEMKANEGNVKNAFALRSDIASNSGNEYSNFIEQWGEDQAKWASLSPEMQSVLMQQDLQQQEEKANNDKTTAVSTGRFRGVLNKIRGKK